MCDINF